ncbi:hypothetical protein ACHAXR_003044 [Thalassiosira sp. AJA248-18]
MAKSKTKKKKKASSSGGLKGFGSSSSSSGSKTASEGTIDRSKSALTFYDYLQRNGGESNLKRVGLGYFPLQIGPNKATDIIQLRGVIALRDIPKGEPIIEIPYEMALDLGRENADPTLPATTLLQKYCTWKSDSDGPPGDKAKGDYFAMLPPYMSDDCLGSTDFFSDGAMEMLQSPMVVEETMLRRELVQARYERDVQPMAQMSSNLYRWESSEDSNNNVATQNHLQWASWIITSRVLTVQGSPESSTANRLLIPLIDMCNHDRDSPHVLTGRAMPGGMLKVVAGADIKSGDAINIGYGGSVEGNDRFIQDYGFLDAGGSKERGKKKGDNEFVAEAYKIVARKLLGKGRSIERMTVAEQDRALGALGETSLDDDQELLASGKVVKSDERMALEYRIGMKKALKQLM